MCSYMIHIYANKIFKQRYASSIVFNYNNQEETTDQVIYSISQSILIIVNYWSKVFTSIYSLVSGLNERF